MPINQMEIQTGSVKALRHATEFLAVPVFDTDAPSAELRELDEATEGRLMAEARRRKTNPGASGTLFIYQTHGQHPAEMIALIGMGRPAADGTFGATAWREFAGRARSAAASVKAGLMAVSIHDAPNVERGEIALGATVEGLLLSDYSPKLHRQRPAPKGPTRCVVLGAKKSARAGVARDRGRIIAEATRDSRDWINLPAAVLHPTKFGSIARALAKKAGLQITLHGPKQLQRLGMGAILGVGQGSHRDECLIELVYRPKGRRSTKPAPDHLCLVGKGITFDSGGLSLKTSRGMEIQKRDMSGGAAVLGAMKAIAALAPDVEVRGLIACAENMPGGNACRPGDVLETYNKKTVEVLNTDAEGRLVLADALGYAANGCGSGVKPRYIVDLATLTGAATVALGTGIGAVMGSDAALVERLRAAGREAGEPLWELPLIDSYRAALASPIADLKNTGDGTAGSIFGGLFLQEFTAGVPWAHLDIAAVAFSDKSRPCVPRGAVGWGVGTLVRLVESIARGD
jgi:leucyl aminopeptidase